MCVGLTVGVLVTAFYAAVILVGVPVRERFVRDTSRDSPFVLVPFLWLESIALPVYRVCMGIASRVQDDANALATQTSKVVEMNHGSFMEMFLGFHTALKYVSRNVVLVGKIELTDHWLAKWLIVRTMQKIGRIILIDRSDRTQALGAIQDYIHQQGQASRDRVYVILCDGTRPTDAKRQEQNMQLSANWQRVLQPRPGGSWTICSLLQEVLGYAPLRIQVAHGMTRPQHTELDAWRVVGSTHHAHVTLVNGQLPDSASAYGPQLTERWQQIDRWLVSLEEKN